MHTPFTCHLAVPWHMGLAVYCNAAVAAHVECMKHHVLSWHHTVLAHGSLMLTSSAASVCDLSSTYNQLYNQQVQSADIIISAAVLLLKPTSVN